MPLPSSVPTVKQKVGLGLIEVFALAIKQDIWVDEFLVFDGVVDCAPLEEEDEEA